MKLRLTTLTEKQSRLPDGYLHKGREISEAPAEIISLDERRYRIKEPARTYPRRPIPPPDAA